MSRNPCACGCGQMVRRQYAHGHNRRRPDALTDAERQRRYLERNREKVRLRRLHRRRLQGAKPPATRAELDAAFWERTDRSGECWEWTGQTIGKRGFGYGVVTRQQERILAHRHAYKLTYGPIPDGLFVCHHCDNPPCIRPDHLFLGTYEDNARDMAAKGRWRNQFASGGAA